MSLRYTFRHLFYGGKIQKERLYKVLEDLDASNSGDDTKISAIETAIGKAEGTGAGGILKDIKDINDTIGATDSAGLKKRCKDIEDAIGDADTEGTILARIKALEDKE
jgi:hypothetical protein